MIDEPLDFFNARFGNGLPVSMKATEGVAEALDEVLDEISRAHPDVRIISNLTVSTPVQCDLGRVRQLLTLLV